MIRGSSLCCGGHSFLLPAGILLMAMTLSGCPKSLPGETGYSGEVAVFQGEIEESRGWPVGLELRSEAGLADELQGELAGGLICTPGEGVCVGPLDLLVCDEAGAAWEQAACAPGDVCQDGLCMPQVCVPGEPEGLCVGPVSFSVCNEMGTGFDTDYCQAPLTCFDGKCAQSCAAGTVTCKGLTAVQEMVLDEYGICSWQVVELCQEGSLCIEGKCESICEITLKQLSYEACEFWAADLDNVEGGQFQPVAVTASLADDWDFPATLTFTDMSHSPPMELTPAQLSVEALTVEPGTMKYFTLPGGLDLDGSALSNRSVHIETNLPITMHQFNPLVSSMTFTNDASLLLPGSGGGKEYVVMSWPLRTDEYILRGFATIVATQEGLTLVSVTPTADVVAGPGLPPLAAFPDTPYEFVLERGDVLNLETDGQEGADLTGTLVLADRKVAVFGGHECANVPLGTNYCDHVEQQLLAVRSWGLHYLADAFKPRNENHRDVWRVMAWSEGTQITLTPHPEEVPLPAVLGPGQFIEFESASHFAVDATGPVLVGHYLKGSNYEGYQGQCKENTGIGDPAFSISIPVEQYLPNFIVLVPEGFSENYINIIRGEGDQPVVKLDGTPVTADFVNVPGTDWQVATVPVDPGVRKIQSIKPVGVTVYGYGCDVSYAYPGGMGLATIGEIW